MDWHKNQLKVYSEMRRKDYGGGMPFSNTTDLKINEAVKLRAPISLKGSDMPKSATGKVTSIGEGVVEVEFDAFGTVPMSTEDAAMYLERALKPKTIGEKMKDYMNFTPKLGIREGINVMDEQGDLFHVDQVVLGGFKASLLTQNGERIVRESKGLVEVNVYGDETGDRPQMVRITGVDPESNQYRVKPVYQGEDFTGKTARVLFGFTRDNGTKVYRVLTDYGPRDFTDSEVVFESIDENIGMVTTPTLGMVGGAPKVDTSKLSPFSPGMRVKFDGVEGTVVEKMDDSCLVAFDDGKFTHVPLAELAA